MRIRFWHILVFTLALTIFVVARAPASVFMPQRPGAFTYERSEGTIWRGRFVGSRLGSIPAGDVAWTVSLVDVLRGRLIADVQLTGGALTGELRLLSNVQGHRRLMASRLAAESLDGSGVLPIGAFRTERFDIYFADGNCVVADGPVEVTPQLANSAVLRGRAVCDGETATIALVAGEDGVTRLSLQLLPNGEGRWRIGEVAPTEGASSASSGEASAAQGEIRWFPF